MAKIAKHWTKHNKLDWAAIENKLASPFLPIDRLPQPSLDLSNPIMSHSKEIWTKMHKMFNLSHCKQSYSSLWHNTMIRIGKTSASWEKWHDNGSAICTIADLFENDVFVSYPEPIRKYKLKGKDQFWRYLQIRSYITSKIQYRDGNHITDFTLSEECHRASVFYRTTNNLLSSDCNNLKVIWEKDLIEDRDWFKLYLTRENTLGKRKGNSSNAK